MQQNPLPRAVVVLCLAALTLLSACEDDAGAPPIPVVTNEPSATATPSPTPEPTQPPPDPELGDRLRYEGDFEGAVAVYEAVGEAGELAERGPARLAQAQLLQRLERYEEARDVLQRHIEASSASPSSTAHLLLGRVLHELNDSEGAYREYQQYILGGGPAANFALMEQAKTLARRGDVAGAETTANEALAGEAPQDIEASFTFAGADAFDAAGRDGLDPQADAAAIAWYRRVIDAPGGDAASALARIGSVRRRIGDPLWYEDSLHAVISYPASGGAASLIDELDAAGIFVPDYTRGFAFYRAFRNADARAALERALAGGESPAESTYYLAALDERAGNPGGAISGYAQVPALNPQSPVADDALWWRAGLLQAASRLDEALIDYDRLIAEYPQSEWHADATFRRGMISFRGGDFASATRVWSDLVATADEDEQPRARFWQGIAMKRAGDAQAEATLRALVTGEPGDFYALRAEVLLGDNDGKESKPDLDRAETDWDNVFAYIFLRTGIDPRTTSGRSLRDARWQQGADLDAAGMAPQAASVFLSLIRDYAAEPAELAQVAQQLQQDGRTGLAARAATRLISSASDEPPIPDELLRVAYPLAYGDLVVDAADDEDISPLLFLSLIRQESFYDPDAGSSAGALGLTQVIPSTGRAIAEDLDVANFDPRDLFRPRVSLRFGASYISDQLRAFDNAYHALAAYNGGPGTAANSIATAGDDIDLFVEDLEFDETKAYVKLVMENYARYRQLYEGLDRPSLPR